MADPHDGDGDDEAGTQTALPLTTERLVAVSMLLVLLTGLSITNLTDGWITSSPTTTTCSLARGRSSSSTTPTTATRSTRPCATPARSIQPLRPARPTKTASSRSAP
ncbi:MAG: hypothetical protein U0841_29925 [Chloroflexia bacterium]